MSHGMQYFSWRDGRPRWIPGPGLRERGFRGRDLKREDGTWLSLEEALMAAASINAEAGVATVRRRVVVEPKATTPRRGFIYFLLMGEHIKIGFTARPMHRVSDMDTAFSAEIGLYVVVPGTMAEERQLHAMFERERIRNEWFAASQRLLNLILRCVKARKVTYGQTAVRVDERGTELERAVSQ